MTFAKTISETDITDFELLHRGKVRDVYAVGEDHILLVATDRISAFDCIMPNQVPGKGQILTKISVFWFNKLKEVSANHLVTTEFQDMPASIQKYKELNGRSILVKKTKVFPVECVVRGYLEGSGWKDYQATGEICGHQLPQGLRQCEKLPEPIFTPATKAPSGHDENIDERTFAAIIGQESAEILKSRTLEIYRKASEYALEKGIIIADTKVEFGTDKDGNILLIDEVLTPDSSRFWSVDSYHPGQAQPSFDKQFVREYLETLDWNKQPPAPELPDEIISATTSRYLEAYKLLTGQEI
jgi:phosphoribosylaminoimidazole-succinocarboxamide synthase